MTLTSTGAAATATVTAPGPTYPIVPSAGVGTGLGNYSLHYASGTLTVNPRPASVTANDKSKYYGDANPPLTATVTGTVNGDTLNYTLATTATQFSGLGGYPITVTLGSNPNYSVTPTNGSLTVNPATLTVTADTQTMVLHGTVPAPLTFQITGFKNGETTSVLTTQPTCTTTATSGSIVGSYPITCSGAAAANYSSTYFPGTLSILYSTGTCVGELGHTVLQPINMSGVMSVFKLGSTVPTKFRVCDANGVSIGTPGVVTGYGLVGSANTPGISVDEDVYSTTPDTAFRWAGDQWIFNQSTKNNSTLNKTGVTYSFGIKLNDGSWIYFQYGLK